jgi:hypothetical protein
MIKGDGTRSDKQLRKGANSLRERVFVFAFFLFLSFIFWYLNSLGKELQAEIRYPVRFINPPRDRVIGENLPSKINLYLTGPGYSMLKLKMSGNRAPVIIDFAQVSYKSLHLGDSTVHFIETSGLIQDMNTQLKSPCRISAIKPDTLFFTFHLETQ